MKKKKFKKVIEAVEQTGVGFKTFDFRANMSYDEILDEENNKVHDTFPVNGHRNGKLHIHFSDKGKFMGSLKLNQSDVNKLIEMWLSTDNEDGSVTVSFSSFGRKILKSKKFIELHLRFGAYPDLDGSCGTVLIEVMPHDKKLKKWFSS